MRIAIVGGGALGSLFAARLSTVCDVVLVTRRAEQAVAFRRSGIRIDSATGSQMFAVAVEAAPLKSSVDAALILTKAYDTASACRSIRSVIGPSSIVVTLQNGLGNDVAIAEVLGEESVVRGVTTEAATRIAPAHVSHAASGTTVLERTGRSEPVVALADRLTAAGFQSYVTDDIMPVIWRKLAANAAINGPTALLGVTNGEIVDSVAARELAQRIAAEVIDAATRSGVFLNQDVAGAASEDLTVAALDVARATRTNVSSMLQDVRAGRPTEWDAIYGAVARVARRHGVPAPICETLALLLEAWAQVRQPYQHDSNTRDLGDALEGSPVRRINHGRQPDVAEVDPDDGGGLDRRVAEARG